MKVRAPRILISAGEASGDRLGAGLARALRQRDPALELIGMGGPQMERAGVRRVQDAAEVAVVGILEVLPHLPRILRAMRRLVRVLDEQRPDLVVPIDFPDFNLRLAARAARRRVGVVYFVSPQVWAWRRSRVRTIRRLVRRMLVLFPFETAFYEAEGVPATFVGHPAVDDRGPRADAASLRAALGLAPDRPIVALLPGSRHGEIRRHLPPMLAAARLVRARHPEVGFLLPLAPGLAPEAIAPELERACLPDLVVHSGGFPEILSTCAVGAVASGTASLEAALEGLPIVVVYRMAPLSHALARWLVRLDHVALPNLIAGRRVVPELIQADCTPERIAEALLAYLDRPEELRRVRAELEGIRACLGGPGVFDRAADAVLAELAAARAAGAGWGPA